ncbi:unnamed protein product, partial [Ectocarpus sp. 8 AP-2014]
ASGTVLNRIFQPAHASSGAGVSREDRQLSGGPLPPGWISRADDSGKIYYQDTVNKTTQWERPTQRPRSNSVSSGRPEVIDMPMAHTRRGSNASSADNSRRSSSSHAHDYPHRRESAAGDPSPPPARGSVPAAPCYPT